MPDSAVNTLPLFILLAGLICVLGVALWKGQVQRREKEGEFRELQKRLDASFSLGGYLLGAQDEKAAVLAAMRAGNELLETDGYAFVPFNEWKQTLPALKHGDLPFLQEPDWQARLSDAVTRHTCRNCEDRQAGPECILLRETLGAEHVYCMALRCGGREIGVVNYFFSTQPQVSESQKYFLGQLVRMTDLTLDSLRVHTQELDALRASQGSVISGDDLKAGNQDLLRKLAYQAVVDERARLAREIHDGLAQTLAFLKMEAARVQTHLAKGDPTSVAETFQDYYQTLSDAYLDTRQSIDNLRQVPDENLADWMNTTSSDFEELTGLTVDISDVKLNHAFPDNIKAQLIRIVQEALTNIRKHADACTVFISAFERGSEAIIEVKDNGRGFAPEDVLLASQYGLRSMRERAESIGADFQIISAPGMGTTIRLQISIRDKVNS
jgi:two-component system nitrate/nitrite sensor histidine kinase NarX